MDLSTMQAAVDRASAIYAMRCDEPEVEAAFDSILDALTGVGDPPAPGGEWNPPPEWIARVYGAAHALIVRFGCDA